MKISKLTPEAREEFLKASAPAYDSGLLTKEQIAAWTKAKGE